MQPHAGLSDSDADWAFVSGKWPCGICGSHEGCRRHLMGQFACCARVASQWPLSIGGWVHDMDREGITRPSDPAGGREADPTRGSPGGHGSCPDRLMLNANMGSAQTPKDPAPPLPEIRYPGT